MCRFRNEWGVVFLPNFGISNILGIKIGALEEEERRNHISE